RAKVIVASSAAALVSDRAYRPAPFPQSTAIFKKSSKKHNRLKSKGNFKKTRKGRKLNSGNPAFRVSTVKTLPLIASLIWLTHYCASRARR
ncbi:hypothetical protein QN224_32600, partial [Sinorhizobium sp. 8-89]|uniref:hypothetical protein n=1 Tax=Sinorhizobium sp. 7-81 TaxID=3049087 RepID=UPI0024C3C449